MASNKTFENAKTLTSKKLNDGRHECLVCPINCKLRNNQLGLCQARIGSEDGVLLQAYGKISHAAIEPIEKKPIYHYRPNLKTLSVGGYGCNLSCSYCQNWMVSQENKFDSSKEMSPFDICNFAISKDCGAICFTYNEPIIYFEYIMDLAQKCKSYNLDFIIKTNAYSEMSIWKELCDVVSAMNIDWKGCQKRYSQFGVSDSEVIKKCIEYAANKTHIEISVPVYYDSSVEEHSTFASFVKKFPFVPIHLLKIYPAYKDIGVQVTSDLLVRKISDLYRSSAYVYIQNVYDSIGVQDTKCHLCGKLIASRESLKTTVNRVDCCGYTIIQS